MAEGNFLIRCPGCGNAQGVTMAVGQQLQCRVCQTVFFAPVVTDGVPVAPAPSAAPTSASPGGSVTTPPAPEDSPVAETRPLDRPSASRSWRTDGLELAPPAGPAPRAESLPAVSQPAAPGTPPENAAPADGGTRIWMLLTIVASLVVVLATSLVGWHFVRKWRPPAQTAGAQGGANTRPPAPTVDPQQGHWTDAAARSQRLGRIEVKVLRAKYGAVRAKDLNNEVITTDDTNLLVVTVSVHNRDAQPCPFRSWYAGIVAVEGGDELLPELSDDAGRSYDLLRFDDVSSIEGQHVADEIEPRQDVQDTVVFLIPTDIDRSKIKYFRLALPAHALGSSDYFRFQIPVSLVVDFD